MTVSTSSATTPRDEAPRVRVLEPKVRTRSTWPWVFLMSIAAVFVRFWRLDQPTIWGDEAAVYWRTCGTFTELLEILKNDGFAPLHYELYWVIHQFFIMTPGVMRFVPAISAVLMVPTMYWLAKQLVGTRTALVVAAFTAVSGHLGWHAHDAKMYSQFWLFCALNMACFIWWLRKGGAIAWWCWAASGVAMVGLHSTGFAIIALQPLMLLAGPRRNWRVIVAYLLGVLVITVGPAIYYLHFNQWKENIDSQGWTASGIAWVESITGRTPRPQLVRSAVSHLLFGYEFPAPWAQAAGRPNLMRLIQDVPVWLGVTLLVALFPWPTRDRGRGISRLPQPWWRTALYIGAWALLPVYAFYCASFAGYPWPNELAGWAALAIWSSGPATVWTVVLLLAAGYFLAPTNRSRLRTVLQGIAVVATIFLLATAIAWASSIRPPGPVWITRYMAFVWPAFVIGIFALLLRLPWPVRWLAISLLIAANLFQCIARASSPQDAPLDVITADILTSRVPANASQAHFLGRSMVGAMEPIERRYYLFMASGEMATPAEFRGGNLRTRFGLSAVSTPQSIVRGLKDAPSVGRLLIWEQVPGPTPGQPQRTYPEKMAGQLPPGWEKVGEVVYPFTGRWGWTPSTAWRRCEYRLVAAPATQPN